MPNLVPVIRELPADLETPVSVYLKLRGRGPSFLLESITGGEQVARYSFIGVSPTAAYVARDRQLTRHAYPNGGPGHTDLMPIAPGRDLLHLLDAELRQYEPLDTPGLPRFSGGLVGYLGYDVVRFFEPRLQLAPHETLPDALFLLADTIVAFDHAFGRLLLIANAHIDGDEARAPASATTADPHAGRRPQSADAGRRAPHVRGRDRRAVRVSARTARPRQPRPAA